MDGIDYIPGNLEKIASALDRIADAVESWVKLEQQRFEKEYPARNTRPATVAVADYTDESERSPEEQGPVFPETVGPREAAILARGTPSDKIRLAREARRKRS